MSCIRWAPKFHFALALLSLLSFPKLHLSEETHARNEFSTESVFEPANEKGNGDHYILDLGQENITQILHIAPPGQPSLLLVALYAPWCRHCEPLLQIIDEVSLLLSIIWEKLFTDLNRPQIGKIDATIEKNLAQYFGAKGYPTLKLILSFPKKQIALNESEQTSEIEGDNARGTDIDSETSQSSKAEQEDSILYIFDYEDKLNSRDSILSFTLHYWFRFVYSPIPNQKEVSPVIWMETAEKLESFLMTYREALLRTDNELNFLHTYEKLHEHKVKLEKPIHNEYMEETNKVVFVLCLRDTSTKHLNSVIDPTNQSYEHTHKDVEIQKFEQDFKDVAFEMIEREDIAFIAMAPPSCHQLGLSETSSMKAIFAPFDKNAIENGPLHDKVRTNQSVKDFVKEQSTPRLVWFDREKNASLVFNGDFTIHTCLFVHIPERYNPNSMSSENWKNYIASKSKTKHAISSMKKTVERFAMYKDNIFLVIPHTEQRIIEYFGIDSFPTLMITDMRRSNAMLKYFLHENEISHSIDAIPVFLEKFYSNELEPTLKSQPLSERDALNHVKVVKGNSFQSMVMEGEKHALVNFYAPWCAHCKHLTPKWNELATIIAESKEWGNKIEIMKMDATKNEVVHPSIDILVFPTIYLFPLGNKTKPILYQGNGTDPNDFIDWFHSHQLSFDDRIKDTNEILFETAFSDKNSGGEL